MKRSIVICFIASALMLAGCGSDKKESSSAKDVKDSVSSAADSKALTKMSSGDEGDGGAVIPFDDSDTESEEKSSKVTSKTDESKADDNKTSGKANASVKTKSTQSSSSEKAASGTDKVSSSKSSTKTTAQNKNEVSFDNGSSEKKKTEKPAASLGTTAAEPDTPSAQTTEYENIYDDGIDWGPVKFY